MPVLPVSLEFRSAPWALLGGGDQPAYWMPKLEEIPWDRAMQLSLGIPLRNQKIKVGRYEKGGGERVRGILGLVTYDAFTPGGHTAPIQSRAFALEDVVRLSSLRALERPQNPPPLNLRNFAAGSPIILNPHGSESSYLNRVEKILEDIREGQYYQLNLLRYFTVNNAPFHTLFPLFQRQSGPMGAWLRLPDLEIASLSPERFVSIKLQDRGDDMTILTEPIKGTSPRGKSLLEDQTNAQSLWHSKKNHAELAMIIDLMRNDLSKIATAGSVKVPDPNPVQLKSFANVHHLVGSIQGSLKKGCALGQVLAALCPGGSITGAPKKAVMEAISQYEGRSRGYFMGHIFWLDEKGQWDSSILIRTLVRQAKDPLDQWEFAAGSGIVIHSDPREESAEIYAKASILTAPSYGVEP